MKNHRHAIYERLGLSGRLDLILRVRTGELVLGLAAVALLLATALAGCAAGARLPGFGAVPPEQAAQLTAFRPSTIGSGTTVTLLIDYRPVLELGAREYTTVTIPAGEHVAGIARAGVHQFRARGAGRRALLCR